MGTTTKAEVAILWLSMAYVLMLAALWRLDKGTVKGEEVGRRMWRSGEQGKKLENL